MNNSQIKFYFILLVVISFISTGCSANSKNEKINKLLTYCADNGMFNGTICVTENDKIIYKNAFGFADLLKGEKLIADHAFYLASVSKQFTTMAVMILKERGKLSYDDPLSKYFSEFPKYADRVTIENLMTHTSGIPDHFNLGAYKPGLTNNDVLELLIKQDTLDFQPGEKYQYSNGAFVLLALIIEKASGQPFSSFMNENIFEPLGMQSTLIYDKFDASIAKRAIGYNIFGEKDDYEILTTGAGGIYSTVEDLAKWDNALSENKLISLETLNEAYTSYKLNNDSLTNYGYGWRVIEDGIGKRVSHSGGLSGFRTFLERDITKNNSFFLLTNFGNAVALNGITEGLRNILNDNEFALPKISILITMNNLINTGGIEIAVEKYNSYKADPSEKYDFAEEHLNNLGYYLLEKKKIAEAIEIFKLNVQSYPQSANTYDSLGEAYMINGNYELAILNFKKSLAIDPKNENANDMLKKIEELKKK
jgi:CubicO group peptidase (beta-lactamase class C family)